MIFGKGDTEKIKIEKISALINALFNKKIVQLEGKGEKIVRELEQAKRQFNDACIKFEELKAEPNIENMYGTNINFIKGQKNSYANALSRIIKELVLEENGGSNIYEKYQAILSNLETTINEMLVANGNFKQVMFCYSKYLGDFKRSFSSMERLRDMLKNELDRRNREYSEYSAIISHLSKISAQMAELEDVATGSEILKKDLDQVDKNEIEKNQAEIIQKIADRKSELAKVNDELSKSSDKINSLIAPLERASKKFDYLHENKKKLYDFISDPINKVSNEAEYAHFKTLIQELKKSVDYGEIEVKNKAEVSSSISSLAGYDIYYMIGAFKSGESKKANIREELGILERTLKEIRDARINSDRYSQDLGEMEKSSKEIAGSIESEARSIERLFLEYYNKSISISL